MSFKSGWKAERVIGDESEDGDCDEVICAGWGEPGGEWTEWGWRNECYCKSGGIAVFFSTDSTRHTDGSSIFGVWSSAHSTQASVYDLAEDTSNALLTMESLAFCPVIVEQNGLRKHREKACWFVDPLTPTVAIWVQLVIKHPVPDG